MGYYYNTNLKKTIMGWSFFFILFVFTPDYIHKLTFCFLNNSSALNITYSSHISRDFKIFPEIIFFYPYRVLGLTCMKVNLRSTRSTLNLSLTEGVALWGLTWRFGKLVLSIFNCIYIFFFLGKFIFIHLPFILVLKYGCFQRWVQRVFC
jgi:hypothetical protein